MGGGWAAAAVGPLGGAAAGMDTLGRKVVVCDNGTGVSGGGGAGTGRAAGGRVGLKEEEGREEGEGRRPARLAAAPVGLGRPSAGPGLGRGRGGNEWAAGAAGPPAGSR